MILNDTFTAADGSLLTAHTSDSGATYVLNPAGSGVIHIHSGRAHADGAAFACSSVEAADCEIEGVLRCFSADGQHAGILGRMSPTDVAWYTVILQFGGGVTLYSSGPLGTFPMEVTPGADYRLKLLMQGTLIRAFIDGYEFQRVIDTEFTAGRIGRCFAGATAENTGLHLDSLTARAQSVTSQVLFHGDSLTSGLAPTPLDWADRYPTQTINLVGGDWDWANLGVSGRSLSDLLANVDEIDDCRRTEAMFDIVVVWGGVNDLAGGVSTSAEVIDRLIDYADGRRALGFQVVVLTLIAADGSNPSIGSTFEASRNAVNTWLRSNWADHFDRLVDVAADDRLSDPTDAIYFHEDGVHLTALGEAAVAENVAAAFEQLALGTLNVTSPADGDICLTGEATEITWTTIGPIEEVRVELSLDGGATYSAVLTEGTGNTGSLAWTPTADQLSATARIRVASPDDTVAAESDVFRIATTTPAGGLTLDELSSALEALKSHGDATWGRTPIMPVAARVNQQPVASTGLVAYQRGRSLHQLVVVDSTGAGINLSGKSLQFTLESLTGATIASTAEVTITGDESHIASLTAEAAWHAQPGLFRYALRDTADGSRVWARGDYLIEPTAGPV